MIPKIEGRVYINLDAHGVTYLPEEGKVLPRPSSHITKPEYDFTKDLLKQPGRVIAQRAFEVFTAIRPNGQFEASDPSGLEGLTRPFTNKLRSTALRIGWVSSKINAFRECQTDPVILKGLDHALLEGIPVILNTGALDTSAIDLLQKTKKDQVLDRLNPGLAIAMRPSEVPVSMKDELPKITTPFSKGCLGLWERYGLGVNPLILEDSIEVADWGRVLKMIVGVNSTKQEAELRRGHATPEFIKEDMMADDAGIVIFRANIFRLIDWIKGLNGVSVEQIGQGEYEFVDPRFLMVKPEIAAVTA